jgi:hypothetical protein
MYELAQKVGNLTVTSLIVLCVDISLRYPEVPIGAGATIVNIRPLLRLYHSNPQQRQ